LSEFAPTTELLLGTCSSVVREATVKFSQHFNIGKSQSQLDFVNIDLNADTQLYLDPYALTTRQDEWSQECHDLLISFFAAVLDAVRAGNRRRGEQLLSRLGEPEETRLGVSKGHSRGRGIGAEQAGALFDAMTRSAAARTGMLEDLNDFALFVPGIGRDKISDMTTNIIRGPLIRYTQRQCKLHDVPMQSVASGFFWDGDTDEWRQRYAELPVCDTGRILLVPKFAVRYQVGVDAGAYRRDFVLEFLREEHVRADDSLVTAIKNNKGVVVRKEVYKKTVDAHYPKTKDFLAEFSKLHPEIIAKYRKALGLAGSKIPDIADEPEGEVGLAKYLAAELSTIASGAADADKYHKLMVGVISFLFFPNLINPQKETPINEGRKRIDITYTNGKVDGFFQRLAYDQHIKANVIHVECKNYTSDIANPEFDQLLARFDANRGRLGILLFRQAIDRDLVDRRCRDARDG
jgi:hypothetical protein